LIDPAYLNAYIDRLRAHDWFYERSDDPRTFKAGQAERQKLMRESDQEPLLRGLYESAAFIYGTERRDARQGQWQSWLTFDEFCEVTRRRLDANATARPDPTHRLAACVRSLANALAQAAPDNNAPSRAMKLLQDLGLLESTLLPKPAEKTHAP